MSSPEHSSTLSIAVIGSSPLCLIHAQWLNSLGHDVSVFDGANMLGGAWSNRKVAGDLDVESACHLFEHYHDVYADLSRYSQVEFKQLDPQPVKVRQDNSKELYSTRIRIFRNLTAMLVQSIALLVVKFGSFGSQRLVRLKNRKINLLDHLKAMWISICYQGPRAFLGAEIWHPIGGSVSFINGLIQTTKATGVSFVSSNVKRILYEANSVKLILDDDTQTRVDMVFTSSSADLESLSLSGHDPDKRRESTYYHSLISVPEAHLISTLQYTHFPDDEDIHRITRIDSLDICEHMAQSDRAMYLVQFRNALSTDKKNDFTLDRMHRANLITRSFRDQTGIVIEENFVSAHIAYQGHSAFGFSKLAERVVMLESIGDLCRTYANWKFNHPQYRRAIKRNINNK